MKLRASFIASHLLGVKVLATLLASRLKLVFKGILQWKEYTCAPNNLGLEIR
jgi:hypothetical protein